MPISDHIGGFIRPGFNPLLVPNAPTIGTASESGSGISITFTAPSDVGGGAITSYEAVATERTTFVVTVVDSGSGNKFVIDGVSQDTLTLQEGATYTFDQSAGTNSTHPLRLSTTSDGTHGGGSEYTTGVTTNGTPGSAGAYTRIVVASGAPTLYYYCSSHSGMGGTVNTTAGATSFTATGTSSPITVSGLTAGQSYTTTVTAINAYGPSGTSAASNNITMFGGGALWMWGRNQFGSLGQGNTTDPISSPIQVGALTDWFELSCSQYYGIIGVSSDDSAWSWGAGAGGQLAQNSITNYSSPVQIGSLTDWSKTDGGFYGPNGGLKTDGTLWLWGKGTYGALGQGNTSDSFVPIQLGSLTTWIQFSAGYYYGGAVRSDNTLWMWGNGGVGKTGQNNTTNYSSPVQVGTLTNWLQVAVLYKHSAAVKTDGTIWSWGLNDRGQLGDGTTTNRSSPVQIGGLTNWSSVALGFNFTLAIKTDGTLWGWGENGQGQLGLGDKTDRSSPVQVGTQTYWTSVAGMSNSTGARTTANTIFTWGFNDYGQLGHNNTTNYSSPVQVGALTTWLLLRSNGNVMGAIK